MFIWGLGYPPTWRGFGATYTGAVIWAAVAFTANTFTGANYAYLSRGPAGASILDLLGPWPIYIFWEAMIIAVVWAMTTLPFETSRARTANIVDDRRTLRRRPLPTHTIRTLHTAQQPQLTLRK